MKNTGIVRKVDDLGRVTLVKEDRRILGINDNDQIIMVRMGQEIRIRKFQETCIICNNEEIVSDYGGIKICNNCLQELEGRRFDKKHG